MNIILLHALIYVNFCAGCATKHIVIHEPNWPSGVLKVFEEVWWKSGKMPTGVKGLIGEINRRKQIEGVNDGVNSYRLEFVDSVPKRGQITVKVIEIGPRTPKQFSQHYPSTGLKYLWRVQQVFNHHSKNFEIADSDLNLSHVLAEMVQEFANKNQRLPKNIKQLRGLAWFPGFHKLGGEGRLTFSITTANSGKRFLTVFIKSSKLSVEYPLDNYESGPGPDGELMVRPRQTRRKFN